MTKFECQQCGNCCRGDGFVRVRADDVDRMAAFLKCSAEAFTRRYTRLSDDRRGLCLIDRKDGSCIFLQPKGRCRVHSVKPKQCRDFPIQWRFHGYRKTCAGAQAG